MSTTSNPEFASWILAYMLVLTTQVVAPRRPASSPAERRRRGISDERRAKGGPQAQAPWVSK